MSKKKYNLKSDYSVLPFDAFENIKEQSRTKYLRKHDKRKEKKSNKLDYWK